MAEHLHLWQTTSCILGPKKGVPLVAAARLQQWAAAYTMTSDFRAATADALSRLPLPEEGSHGQSETQLCNLREIEALPMTSREIRAATIKWDPELNKVKS